VKAGRRPVAVMVAVALAVVPLALLGACTTTGGAGPSTPAAISPTTSPSPVATPTSTLALPPDLADATWVTMDPPSYGGSEVAGTLTQRTRLVLPPGERALAAGNGLVLSTGLGPSDVLTVRSVSIAGALPVTWTAPGQVGSGQLVGDAVVYTAGGPGELPGIYLHPLSGAAERVLTPPAPSPDGRGPLIVAPSGDLVGSSICQAGNCDLQLIDLRTGSVSVPVHAVASFLSYLTDNLILTVDDTTLYAYGVGGGLRWSIPDMRLDNGGGYLTSDGSRLIALYHDLSPAATNATRLSAVDLKTGTRSVVMTWGANTVTPWLWGAVSSDTAAVLLPDGQPPESQLAATNSIRGDVLDLTTGTLAAGALELPAP
jgi:hypothetical protein